VWQFEWSVIQGYSVIAEKLGQKSLFNFAAGDFLMG
jgi:hypothetical protein